MVQAHWFDSELPLRAIVDPTNLLNEDWSYAGDIKRSGAEQVQEALGQPLFVQINSMVILGKEPVIVDTGFGEGV